MVLYICIFVMFRFLDRRREDKDSELNESKHFMNPVSS